MLTLSPGPAYQCTLEKNRMCEALNLWTNKHITLFFRHPVCLLNHYDNVQYNFSDIVYLAYVYRNLWMPAKFWYQYVRVSHLGEELWILSSRRKNTDTQPHTTWSDDSSLIRVRVEALFLLKRIIIFINLYICWIFMGVHFLLQLIFLFYHLVFVFVNLNVV